MDNLEIIKQQYPEYTPQKIDKKYNNLSGQRFGKLIGLYRTNNSKEHMIQWVFLCDCGNVVVKRAYSVVNGLIKSCGCSSTEYTTAANRKYNEYDLSGNYGIGYTTNTHKEFFFDKDDYNLIKDYCWYENDSGYIMSSTNCDNNRLPHIRMHRLIIKAKDEEIVDHINNKRYDNRKNNLRIVTQSQNNMNRSYSKNNSLKVKGIHKRKDLNHYVAEIGYNNKRIYLGNFHTLEEAKEAREKAEKELFGEYAYNSDPVEQNLLDITTEKEYTKYHKVMK